LNAAVGQRRSRLSVDAAIERSSQRSLLRKRAAGRKGLFRGAHGYRRSEGKPMIAGRLTMRAAIERNQATAADAWNAPTAPDSCRPVSR
jgi:hypothetical protein